MVRVSRTSLAATGAAILVAVAIAALTSVYSTLSQTDDEAFHLACGMEWLDKGTYTLEAQHPPLARVMDALIPYWRGLRSHSRSSGWDEGNDILNSGAGYMRVLMWARLGALPFFVLAAAAVFVWGRRWFSLGTAVWGVFLFVCLPPVLAAASQATTDMACAATVTLALFAFICWMEQPDKFRSAVLGCTLALALLSKLSSVPFLFICIGTTGWYFLTFRREWLLKTFRINWRNIFVTAGVCAMVVWSGYRFSFHSISQEHGYEKTLINVTAEDSPERRLAAEIANIPFPMPEFFHGFYMVARHNQAGHDSFLLGEYRDHGWWSFFPVMLLIKTPIGFLILAAAGAVIVASQITRRTWQRRMTVLYAAAILGVCMLSNLNLGVRHILPIYALLAVLGGYAISKAFRNTARWVTAPAAVLLAGWVAFDAWTAKPDYITYVNQLAGEHPERITIEGDLGQDLRRLSLELRSLGATEVAVKVSTTARLEQADLPRFREIPPFERVSGYVAISDRFYEMGYAQNKSYAWLRAYQPLKRVGKTITLYRIP
jgi:hypothetical protein